MSATDWQNVNRLSKQYRRIGLIAVFAGVLPGCTEQAVSPVAATPPRMLAPTPLELPSAIALPSSTPPRPEVSTRIERGTGHFVNEPSDSSMASDTLGEPATLDFANADVRDVVRAVLGDVLKVPYAIDPSAQGTITLQSGGPIPRSRVMPELESALRLSGLAVVDGGGLYKVVPLAQATHEVQLSRGGADGFVARIVTPHYVAASDLEKLLQPLVPPGTILRAEPTRNVLIISGPAQDVTSVLNNLAVFDVDTIRGMSTALLPLHAAQARDVAKEVSNLLAGLGETGQLVRVEPLDRLNAILVTSMKPAYLDRVRRWVDGLDKASGSATRQLFVYSVQNGRAADLAGVLDKALGIGGGETARPSQPAGSAASPGSGSGIHDTDAVGGLANPTASSPLGGSANPLLGGVPDTQTSVSGSQLSAATGPNASDSQGGSQQSDIRITADETNNALLVLATQQQYASIEAALRRLDIPPLQVMVEATLAEVTLTNDLSYGLQYYVKSGNLQALFSQAAAGNTDAPFKGFGFAPGLNFAYGTTAGSTVILQALQQLTKVHVLSSPNLLVSNNQPGRIQIGDQVPIATGSAVSTISSGAPIVNSIEYRDTGVILRITPRVNASGMVSLDVGEEVSNVLKTSSSSINSPTISERRLDTTVVVKDGQTVALGGLISDNRTTGKDGIPILQDIPGVGWLFGQRSNNINQTELIAILTPHVVRTPFDMHLVTEELQQKLPLTIPVRGGRP